MSIGIAAVLLFLITTCSQVPGVSKNGGSGNGGGSSGIVLDKSNGANTIQSLPDLKLKNTPDSLSTGSDLKLKSMQRAPSYANLSGNHRSLPIRGIQRAQGDVTSFDLSSLEDVKSQGWINMRSQLKDSTVVIFLDILKTFASNQVNAGKTIPLGTDVYIGTQYVAQAGQSLDLGYIKCVSPLDNEFDVYWAFNLNLAGNAASSLARSGVNTGQNKRGATVGGSLTYYHRLPLPL